jgi:hypothetical protein
MEFAIAERLENEQVQRSLEKIRLVSPHSPRSY